MKIFIYMIMLLFSCYSLAETSLWRVAKNGHQLFLGGTVHLLAEEDLPFPVEFDHAYSGADKVIFETDIAALSDPQIQMQLMSQLSYQDGRLLNQIISPELYEALNTYLKQRELMPNLFISMKPAGVMLTMLAVEFKRLGISQAGADSFYFQQAIADGKTVGELEAIDAHIRSIVNMGQGNEESFLRQTLADMKETEVMMKGIVQHWKSGDVQRLEADVIDDMRLNYPRMYQSLLVERNKQWLPQIKQMLENDEVEFVLVGVGHLIGSDGLLKSLADQGYSIEQQ
ncbi:TraB/GumN family protein [Neptuniibacter marinus]|uniref:TraB/GumN family protein n=1 Tax=Neptuniibacter marinus TaxID=1806670 RepID=UPI003B58BD9C